MGLCPSTSSGAANSGVLDSTTWIRKVVAGHQLKRKGKSLDVFFCDHQAGIGLLISSNHIMILSGPVKNAMRNWVNLEHA